MGNLGIRIEAEKNIVIVKPKKKLVPESKYSTHVISFTIIAKQSLKPQEQRKKTATNTKECLSLTVDLPVIAGSVAVAYEGGSNSINAASSFSQNQTTLKKNVGRRRDIATENDRYTGFVVGGISIVTVIDAVNVQLVA